MPSDDDLAKRDAEMLMHSEQYAGLFGKAPKPTPKPLKAGPDLGRRSLFGLSEQAPLNMPPTVIPQASTSSTVSGSGMGEYFNKPAETSTPGATASGMIDKLINTPVTRRQVLKQASSGALQSVVPMPKITDVRPEIVSPLVQAAEVIPGALSTQMGAALGNIYWDHLVNSYTDNPKDFYTIGYDALSNGIDTLTAGMSPAEKKNFIKHAKRLDKFERGDPDADHSVNVVLDAMESLRPEVRGMAMKEDALESPWAAFGNKEEATDALLGEGFGEKDVKAYMQELFPDNE